MSPYPSLRISLQDWNLEYWNNSKNGVRNIHVCSSSIYNLKLLSALMLVIILLVLSPETSRKISPVSDFSIFFGKCLRKFGKHHVSECFQQNIWNNTLQFQTKIW